MDNRYFEFGCPGRMSDGRHFTDYHEKYTIDDYFQQILKSSSNEHVYRKTLQANTDKIINGFQVYFTNNNKCKCNTIPCRPYVDKDEFNKQFERTIIITDKPVPNPKKMYGLE